MAVLHQLSDSSFTKCIICFLLIPIQRIIPKNSVRCATLLMYDLSFVEQILQRRDQLTPRYTDRELRNVMWQPMTLWDILRTTDKRAKNLAAYILCKLPPSLAVFIIRMICGKIDKTNA